MDEGNDGNENPNEGHVQIREGEEQRASPMDQGMKDMPQPAFDFQPVELLKLQNEIRNEVGQAELQENKHNLL